MGFALEAVSARASIKRVNVVGQFGKFTKLASGYFKTHCTDSSVELDFLAAVAAGVGAKGIVLEKIKKANTAREVFLMLKEKGLDKAIGEVCALVKSNSMEYFPKKDVLVCSILVGYNGKVEVKKG